MDKSWRTYIYYYE